MYFSFSCFSYIWQIGKYLQFMLASYSLAFVFSLMFELPMMNIDKDFITGLLHGSRSKPTTHSAQPSRQQVNW